MAGTGERMLELLALLQARHRSTGDSLARRLGVSERTLRRDVERLRALGYPVHADRGVDGGYRLGPGTRLPPLLLSGEEAVAVAIGLRQAASQPISGISDAAVSALVKIIDMLPAGDRHQFEALTTGLRPPPGATPDPAQLTDLATLTDLARAARDAVRIRFNYRDGTGHPTDRYVEPHEVVPVDRRWYLVAWDLDRDDWRTFRLDRITGVHTTRRGFEPRRLPAPDAATFVELARSSQPLTHRVEVLLAASAAVVAAHLGPWGTATEAGPDRTTIRMTVDDLSWVVLMLAAIDADVERAEPPELVDLLRSVGHRFSRAAEQSLGPSALCSRVE
ncbi:MAG: helix-turn-helix transcriptional regulator [Acidimicrobiales bacterium]